MKRTELGELTDLAAVEVLVSVDGLCVVDAGCGPGAVSRELAAIGATVLGIEPDPVQAEKNRHAEPAPGLSFIEAQAQALPVETGSMDGVFFFRSLHHVPIDQMDNALREAARVLKPETGFLCVVEPDINGAHSQVMRPFHDETLVRAEAQSALNRMSKCLFRDEAYFQYVRYPRYPTFEALVARVTGQSFNDIKREDVEKEEVRALFERGRSSDGDYVFDQPMLVNFYRGPTG